MHLFKNLKSMGSGMFRIADDLQLLLLSHFSLKRNGGVKVTMKGVTKMSQNLNPVKQ